MLPESSAPSQSPVFPFIHNNITMKRHYTRTHFTAALLLGTALPVTAADFTATWNGTTGNWSDATKWSTNPAFPNNGVNTFDAVQSSGTVTLTQDIAIQKLSMSSSATNNGGGFNLTLNDLLTFSSASGSATLTGAGTINANGGANFNGNGDKDISGGRVLTLGGSSAWTAGRIRMNNATINNTATGTFTTNFDGTMDYFSSPGGSFNNAGIFTKSGGTGETIIRGLITFNNTGTLNVNSGTLTLQGPSNHSGTVVLAGTTLNLTASTHTLNVGTTFTGTGTISLNNSATMTVATATTIPVGIAFNYAGGTFTSLNGTGTLTVNGPMTWTGGVITGAGMVDVNGGLLISGTADKDLSAGRVLNLNSATTWSAGGLRMNNATINNTATGTFTTNFDGTISHFSSPGGTFNNAGIFTKSGGTGTTQLNGATAFNNTGTVNANSGTLLFSGSVAQHSGTTLTGGAWNVTNGSTLTFSGGSNLTTIGSAASVTLDGTNSTFNRLGSVTASTLTTNQGSFTIKNDRDLTTAGAYTNSGTTRVEDSTTVMTIGSGGSAAYTQTGGVTALVNGAFIDPSVFNLNGGTLQGTGTIESSVIAGPGSSTIAPGMSPGMLTINGNLTLSSGSTLAMELGGLTQGSLYDHLDVNGVLTLAGMLDLDFINDFQNSLPSGEILTLATANSAILGSFSNVASGSYLMTNFPIGLQVWYGADSPYGAENLVVAVPEPSRALLVLAGLQALWLRRRRPVPATA